MTRFTRRTACASALASVALASGAFAAASDGWSAYVNGRFGFRVEYPAALLRPQREADNGDGRHFLARRGSADVAASGGYNALEETPAQLADDAQKDCAGGRAAYRKVWRDGAVVSCPLPGGRLLYVRTWLRDDVVSTLDVRYAAAERATWDPIVARMSRTFAPGGGPA